MRSKRANLSSSTSGIGAYAAKEALNFLARSLCHLVRVAVLLVTAQDALLADDDLERLDGVEGVVEGHRLQCLQRTCVDRLQRAQVADVHLLDGLDDLRVDALTR